MRKPKIIVALVAMLTLTSCGTVAYDEEQAKTDNNAATRLVTFSVATASLVSTNDTGTRADKLSTNVKDRCSYLQYWIYDENYTTIIASATQTSAGTTNFGSFTTTLADGKYHVIAVGHNGLSEMVLNDSTKLLSLGEGDDRNRDTYYANLECEISEDGAFSLTLKRNMCLVLVRSYVPPTNISKVLLKRSAYGTSFYVNTGYSASELTETSYTITVPETDRSKEYGAGMYFPLPSSEEVSNVSISLTPVDLNNKELTTVTIDKIPAKIGREIIYDGALWGEDISFSISVSDENWEVINKTY